MLQYERQLRSVIFFFFQPLLQEVGPFGKRKEERKEESHRVQGSTEREEQNYLHHLLYLITHVCKVTNTEPHSCIRMQHVRVSLQWSCLTSLFNGNVFDLYFLPAFCKVRKMEPAKEER